MSKVDYKKARHAKAAAHEDAAKRLRETYDIFLAGPFIDIEKDAAEPENTGSPAKELRYWLYGELTALGHRVYLGEDVELRTNGSKHYGRRNNAVIFERHHIVEYTDALIVLPSSVGSFCETGDWVTSKETCSKMLMLVEKKYEGETNYINLGPVEMARMFLGKVEYIDYADKDRVFDECLSHIQDLAEARRVDQLYGR
ncbi:hypothetical protein G5B38_06585 [Pseudohalocynthiibacter aestuariivivens]|nr:hypothetical protein [Pseudohalocynthiibacter aestuariivivens]QIE45219.1 hypothetical protein G5B38_06585 [Pseudohalocynthiibacter aestuariivivens]